jgi:hypothetical protein
LLALGETPERWSLLGSIWRRRAQCVPPQVMAEALAAAKDAYATADKLHRERTGQVDFYPALNRVALEWLLTQHTAARSTPRMHCGSLTNAANASPTIHARIFGAE